MFLDDLQIQLLRISCVVYETLKNSFVSSDLKDKSKSFRHDCGFLNGKFTTITKTRGLVRLLVTRFRWTLERMGWNVIDSLSMTFTYQEGFSLGSTP